MRIFAISVLSIFVAIPAFADARLPIVNVGAGSVSARSAFGETIERPTVRNNVSAPRTVVARTASVDTGAQIARVDTDVLAPRRPSGDLWARAEKPLRLPEPSEFSVIRNDFDLPEETLDSRTLVARAPVAAPRSADVVISNRGGELDAEIAKLVELQRRADESVRVVNTAPVSRPATINSYDVRPVAPSPSREVANVAPVDKDEKIAVRRVVVPMTDDVVVRAVQKESQPKFTNVSTDDMSKMSPTELKKAFKKTYLSENKHLSTYQIDDRFDVASDFSSSAEGFTAVRDLSEVGGVRPLEIKIGFRGDDSALSRDNYNLLSEYAGIVVSNPKRAIQIAIPERATRSADGRKLAARRLAIVEQVLRDTGVSDQRIMPVLAARNDDSFVLRVISSDQYETMNQQKRDMFGDTISKKTYKNMTW